ncbi:uncharacterized protein IWZ02DRAFT_33171 [Phyllosticta citriasiana]|uniref:uncharacterized protein n=1 Tax=Phyllosticta citriasiana TaxID=595635 RepID=UPI0030FD73C4
MICRWRWRWLIWNTCGPSLGDTLPRVSPPTPPPPQPPEPPATTSHLRHHLACQSINHHHFPFVRSRKADGLASPAAGLFRWRVFVAVAPVIPTTSACDITGFTWIQITAVPEAAVSIGIITSISFCSNSAIRTTAKLQRDRMQIPS